MAFVNVYDGSSSSEDLQLVLSKEVLGEAAFSSLLPSLTLGSSFECTGHVQGGEVPGAKRELHVSSMEMVCANDATYPLQNKKMSVDFLRAQPHLRHNTRTFAAVFQMRSKLAQFVHQHYTKEGFHYVHTPILSPLDCEGAGELFQVQQPDKYKDQTPLFKSNAYLTVSGQLYGEAMCQGLGNIYTFGPTFRAEKSHTSRHLAEFWMIEPEMAFADLNDAISSLRAFFQEIGTFTLGHASELETLSSFFHEGGRTQALDQLEAFVSKEIQEVSYREALDIVNREMNCSHAFGYDFQRKEEKFLCEYVGGALFVRDFPASMKPFYMRSNDGDDGLTSASVDLLVPHVGEVVGGGQREERYDLLSHRMQALGLLPPAHSAGSSQESEEEESPYAWYLNLRKYGSQPHSGYGIGFERMVSFLLGVPNVRDVTAFPRFSGQKL